MSLQSVKLIYRALTFNYFTGTGIMSEVFMEELLHKKTHKDYLEKPLKSFLHPPRVSYASLVAGGYDANFLGAPAGTVRIKIVQKSLEE